jgi:hypothetical protein
MEYVRTITGMTDRDHDRMVKYYAGLCPEERASVHGLHTIVSRELSDRKDRTQMSAFFYGTFIVAIRRYKISQNPNLSKRMTQRQAALIGTLQATHRRARPGRPASAAQVIVEEHYEDIRAARARTPRPESWRSITARLSAHGQKISHTALKNIWERLEEEGGP